jgi:hypothetical protein
MQLTARTKEIILRYKSIHRCRDNGRHFYADGIRYVLQLYFQLLKL